MNTQGWLSNTHVCIKNYANREEEKRSRKKIGFHPLSFNTLSHSLHIEFKMLCIFRNAELPFPLTSPSQSPLFQCVHKFFSVWTKYSPKHNRSVLMNKKYPLPLYTFQVLTTDLTTKLTTFYHQTMISYDKIWYVCFLYPSPKMLINTVFMGFFRPYFSSQTWKM